MKSSNCTLLELKLLRDFSDVRRAAVLIVPYWNWNIALFPVDSTVPSGSNCTLLELKHDYEADIDEGHECSNCTLLELKQDFEFLNEG